METTQTIKFNCSKLATSIPFYDHVQTHLKNGLFQITNLASNLPKVSFIGSLGQTALVNLELKSSVVERWNNFQEQRNIPDSLSVRNLSVGKTFLLTREFFGPHLDSLNVAFYKRPEKPDPEFVEMTVEYTDSNSRTVHSTILEPHVPPAINQLKGTTSVHGKVLLSAKTATGLHKWLREVQKEYTDTEIVKVCLEQDLYLITFVVGARCKTIEYKPLDGNPSDCFVYPLIKPVDSAAVTKSDKCYVTLKSLTMAIGVCKIPGKTLPLLQFLESSILQILAAPLTNSAHVQVDLSVVLLNAQHYEAPTELNCETTTSLNEKLTVCKSSVKKSPLDNLVHTSESIASSLTTKSSNIETTEGGNSGDCISDSDSEHSIKLDRRQEQLKDSKKRPRSEKSYKKSSKKIKLTFNPLV